MNINTESNITLSDWAKQFSKDQKASIDYFLKFGSPVEKALCQTVLDIAKGE